MRLIIDYYIDQNRQTVMAKAAGELTFDEIIAHYHVLFSDPLFYQGISGYYDFTQVSHVTGDVTSFAQIAKDMGDNSIITQDAYVAIVVPDDNDSIKSIFEAYAQMMDYTNMHVSVFTDESIALAWLHGKSIIQPT